MRVNSWFLVLALVACKSPPPPAQSPESHKQSGPPPAPGGEQGGQPQGQARQPNESGTTEEVTSLDEGYQLEPARTTSDHVVPTPWLEPTPTLVPPPPATVDKLKEAGPPGAQPEGQGVRTATAQTQGQPMAPPAAKPPREWTAPALLIGRAAVFVQGREVAKVRCRSEQPESCQTAGLHGPTGTQTLDLDDAALSSLAQAAAVWRDQDVAVIADRRIAWSSVDAAATLLTRLGARPHVVAATYAGKLARVMPQPGGESAPVPTEATAAAVGQSGGEQGEGVPDDLSEVKVEVTGHGMSLVLGRKAGEPTQPELVGNVLETLCRWAERVRTVAPAVTKATIAADPSAPLEEVVRAIDALRDTCGRQEKTVPCHDRRRLFADIGVQLAETPAAPAEPAPMPPAEESGGLRLGPGQADPAHGAVRLQLDNRVTPQLQPASPRLAPIVPGLRLQPGP